MHGFFLDSARSAVNVGWIDNPVLLVLLLIIGISGIGIAMLLRGFWWSGIVGVAAFIGYFACNYTGGESPLREIGLFILGILLLVLELFVPSFGILGLLGATGLFAALVMVSSDPIVTVYMLLIALVLAVIIMTVVARRFRGHGRWNWFILRESLTSDQGFVSSESRVDLQGKTGLTVTALRPAGIVDIHGERIDVVTEGEFIAASHKVIVTKVEGMRVIVKVYEDVT